MQQSQELREHPLNGLPWPPALIEHLLYTLLRTYTHFSPLPPEELDDSILTLWMGSPGCEGHVTWPRLLCVALPEIPSLSPPSVDKVLGWGELPARLLRLLSSLLWGCGEPP